MGSHGGADSKPPATRVVLSMATLVPGGMGGTETYARGLTQELAERSDLDISVLLPAPANDMFEGVNQILLPTLRGRGSTRDRLATVIRAANPAFAGRRALSGADVVHYPFSVAVPRRQRGTRMIQTLHDVQHHDLPELFSSSERRFRALTYDGAARSADRVITVSEFCRERIITRLGLAPERVNVVHLGVDQRRFHPFDGPRRSFVLYPARSWALKNHVRLL